MRGIAKASPRCWSPWPARFRPSASNAGAARLREEIGGGAGWVGDAIERLHGSLRDSLGDAAFESAWERGRALSTDEAIALGLVETELDA